MEDKSTMSETSVPAIDYTARDFATIKEALKVHLKAKFPNTWRDFYESSVGVAIMDLVCYSHDVLSFFLDYTANELYLSTARDRLSVLLLGRLVGYQLRTATSASVVCTIRVANLYAEAIIVPAGTTLRSTTGVDFVTVEDARIEAGQLEGEITFVQGVNTTSNFSSDGAIWQKFVLTETPVILGTVTVLVDGAEWTEVDSLVYSGSDSNNFAVEYDENSVGKVCFGDGVSGRVPPAGAVITVSYRTGGGVNGNLSLNQLVGNIQGYRELVLPISYVSVSVANDTYRGSGGEEAESVNHAKLWIPAWVKANSRAVTEDDYDALANTFSDPVYGAPAYAKAKLKQELPELNTVQLFVWGRDSGGVITTPSTGLKNALSDYFNNTGAGGVRMICTHTEVEDGLIMYIDVNISIKVVTSYTEADVILSVQQAIDGLFASSSIIPGQDFRISALYTAVHSLAGVSYCLVQLVRASYRTNEAVGLGDGFTTSFSDTLDIDPGIEVIPLTVRMFYGDDLEVLTDDGNGNIINQASVIVGTIDYETGAITGNFAAAPALGTIVYVQYRYTLDYQRGEQEATGDGVTRRFKGAVRYPPINPYDVPTSLKGIAFSDGTQVVTDDGDGKLVGDVDPAANNVIDYGTGGYDFTFLNPPALDAAIWSTYRQILETDSEDIPVGKDEMPVKGFVNVEVLDE